MPTLNISFDGFWLCRLATDPDPSAEQRGISGFTYSVAGETLLDPSFWSQSSDIQKTYGFKAPEFRDPLVDNPQFNIQNIREASPDYARYNERGIGIKVTKLDLDGFPLNELDKPYQDLAERLTGGLVRFEKRSLGSGWNWEGPIFEGRNQITSDGDPDRFTLNPFVFSLSSPYDELVLRRFDPLDLANPNKPLIDVFPNDPLVRRLPLQRFAMSTELMNQVGIDPDLLEQHFVNRAQWLQEKIAQAEASENPAMAEAYRSRLYAVNFFTQSTGPTVLSNRLLSRISLRQLYHHTIRGVNTPGMEPFPFAKQDFFSPLKVDTSKEWEILYYLGAFDGDLMAGWASGTLSLPVEVVA